MEQSRIDSTFGRRRLTLLGSAVIAVTLVAAAPAYGQGQNDTTPKPAKTDNLGNVEFTPNGIVVTDGSQKGQTMPLAQFRIQVRKNVKAADTPKVKVDADSSERVNPDSVGTTDGTTPAPKKDSR